MLMSDVVATTAICTERLIWQIWQNSCHSLRTRHKSTVQAARCQKPVVLNQRGVFWNTGQLWPLWQSKLIPQRFRHSTGSSTSCYAFQYCPFCHNYPKMDENAWHTQTGGNMWYTAVSIKLLKSGALQSSSRTTTHRQHLSTYISSSS